MEGSFFRLGNEGIWICKSGFSHVNWDALIGAFPNEMEILRGLAQELGSEISINKTEILIQIPENKEQRFLIETIAHVALRLAQKMEEFAASIP